VVLDSRLGVCLIGRGPGSDPPRIGSIFWLSPCARGRKSARIEAQRSLCACALAGCSPYSP
jgi:hypothetical protein